MSEHHRHLWALEAAVSDLRARFDDLEAVADDEDDERTIDVDSLDAAGALLEDLEDAVAEQRVHVALLGDTNAGKSTLLNAVLGARLLPSSSHGPGTAVITSVSHRPGPTITVRIHFATKANLRRACQELLDQLAIMNTDDEIDLDVHDLVDASKRRLGRVFGESLDDYLATGHVSVLREVDEAAAIVEEGVRVVEATDPEEVHRTLLAHADAAAAIGYLVERVDITGDFAPLATGVTLLDLPGLNDPDARRTAATRQAVAESQVVWVVYPLDTGLGTSTIRAVQSTLTAHHLLLNPSATRLRFICTKNETVADDTAWRLGLAPHATDAERRAARDRATRTDLADKLEVLLRPMDRRLGDLALEAIRTVRDAPVHLVSAHEALAAMGSEEAGDERPGNVDPLAAELLAIGNKLVPADAVGAHGDAVDQIAALLVALETGEATAAHADTDSAVGEPNLAARLREFAAELRHSTAIFVDESAEAASTSFEDVARLRTTWDSLSPQVLQAIVLRRGFFTGQGGAHYDSNADIAQSFFLALQQPWVRFFRADMPALVKPMLDELAAETTERPIALLREAQRFVRDVERDLLQAVVETVRERFVPHYDRLVRDPAIQSRSDLLDGLVAAIEAERDQLRQAVVASIRSWLGSVIDDLITAAYADARPRPPRVPAG